MSELGDQIADYVDAVSAPIALSEVLRPEPDEPYPEPSPPDRPDRRPSRRWTSALAVAASISLVLAVTVAVVGNRAEEPSGVEVGDDPITTSTSAGPGPDGWLTPFGPEATAPTVPAGWTVMDIGDERFAVPSDWPVVRGACGPWDGVNPPGLVLVTVNGAPTTCDREPVLPESVLTITDLATADPDGEPTMIGALRATPVPQSCATETCPRAYRLDDGLTVAVSGPDADAVLATFTDSGARRALQDGPLAGRDGWKTVPYEGVAFAVPPDWTFVDLPGSYSRTTTADGGVSQSGQLAPGACGFAMFGDAGRVTVGEDPTRIPPSCPYTPLLDLAPGNGAWIRPISEDEVDRLGSPVTQGAIGDLQVTIIDVDHEWRQHPAPVLDVIVRAPSGTLWLTIGSGTDASVVRSLLRSLRAT